MSSRLSVLLGVLPLLAWASLAQAADGARMFEGAPFYAQYIVDYWRQPSVAVAANPSLQAPGRTVEKTHTGGGPTQGPGVVAEGSLVTALVLRPLAPASRTSSVHPSAAALDRVPTSSSEMVANSSDGGDAEPWTKIRTGLLTISDRVSTDTMARSSI